MGVDASVVGGVSVGEAREAIVLHNADPPVRAPELLDHAFRDFHGVADDIVLADRAELDESLMTDGTFNRGGGHMVVPEVLKGQPDPLRESRFAMDEIASCALIWLDR